MDAVAALVARFDVNAGMPSSTNEYWSLRMKRTSSGKRIGTHLEAAGLRRRRAQCAEGAVLAAEEHDVATG